MVRIFLNILYYSQSGFICTESILFQLYGFKPSVFSIYFIRFFVLAQNQLFSLLFFFFLLFLLFLLFLIVYYSYSSSSAHLIFGYFRFVLFVFLTYCILYLEPSLMSGVGFLQKIVNGFKLLIVFADDFGFDVSLGYEFALSLFKVSNMVVLLFLFSISF